MFGVPANSFNVQEQESNTLSDVPKSNINNVVSTTYELGIRCMIPQIEEPRVLRGCNSLENSESSDDDLASSSGES